MFLKPYDTTIGSNYNTSKLESSLSIAQAQGVLATGIVPNVPDIVAVIGKSIETESIPPFNHPFLMGDDKFNKIVIDLRPYQSKIKQSSDGTWELPDTGPVGLLVKQAKLQIIWRAQEYERFADLPDVAIMVYSRWIAEAITRRLGVDPETQMKIVTLASWFYLCTMFPESQLKHREIPEDDRIRMAARIARTSLRKIDDVLPLIEQVGYLHTVTDFVQALKGLDSRRLQAINNVLLFTLISGSWYGSASAKEVAGISVEYPPFFLAVMHTAINESMYRKTPINEIALRYKRKDGLNRFNVAMRILLDYAEE